MHAGKLQEKNMKIIFFLHLYSQWRKESDPDPLVRGTEPWIQIHTKMPRIPNTVLKSVFYFWLCAGNDTDQIFLLPCFHIQLLLRHWWKNARLKQASGSDFTWRFQIRRSAQGCASRVLSHRHHKHSWTSVGDSWYFDADPDPRISNSD